MTVKRIIVDIAAGSVAEVSTFYQDLFSLDVVMDQGWIATLSSGQNGPVQVSIASEGGSGTPVPDMSIEVDNVDEVLARAKAMNVPIIYEITDEPWGVRRFYLRDPAGKLVNVMSHL